MRSRLPTPMAHGARTEPQSACSMPADESSRQRHRRGRHPHSDHAHAGGGILRPALGTPSDSRGDAVSSANSSAPYLAFASYTFRGSVLPFSAPHLDGPCDCQLPSKVVHLSSRAPASALQTGERTRFQGAALEMQRGCQARADRVPSCCRWSCRPRAPTVPAVGQEMTRYSASMTSAGGIP